MHFTTFPVNADDLQSPSSRAYLACINALMKNTLLRAFNRIADLAPTINGSHDTWPAFMDYVATFAEVTCLHLQGDERFFTLPTAQGKRLVDCLGESCNPNAEHLNSSLKSLAEKAREWKEVQESYTREDLHSMLGFGRDLVEVMRKQLDCMQNGEIEKEFSEDVLRGMIQENIEWMSRASDITALLSFILSHHDVRTCPDWPAIPAEGCAELLAVVKIREHCWRFSPFDPITREPRLAAL